MKSPLLRIAALALATFATAAQAQGYPTRPVTLIVPFAAGGPTDTLARILAERISRPLGQAVVVENVAGAGGTIANNRMMQAAPDGHTVAIGHLGTHVLAPAVQQLNVDYVNGFEPVAMIATNPQVMVSRNELPARDLKELVAHVKANPGKVSYASQGNGSTSHLTAAMFMQLTGTQMVHVPYKGTAPALVDLVAGNVDVFFDNISSSAQFHTANRLRVLAVADDKRSPALPQVPTFAEAKLPAMKAVTFFAMVAPPGTPREAVEHAHKAFSDALAAPDVRQRFMEQGASPGGSSPEQTGRFIREESERWSNVIRSAKVIVE